MARDFRTVGVIGLGTMGAGIVEVFARAGLEVVGLEPTEDALERGRGHLTRSVDRAVAKGRLGEDDRDALLARVRLTTATDDLAEVDLLVEAVPERLELKQDVVAAADKVCRPDTVLATNTSSLSVTEIAAASSRPARVVGMHFFNPAPVLRLVEVVRTVVTDPDVVDDVSALATRLGKSPVVVSDRAGFVANALLFGYLNRAVAMVGSGHVSREDVDAAMRLGCGYPMGPLALLDLIGLDTAYEILATMHGQSRDRLHAPAPVLRQMVTAGLTGRKSGRGFFTYAEPGSPVVVADDRTPGERDVSAGARPVEKVGVVGAGPVASGLGEALAAAGYDVRAVDDVAAGLDDLADRDLVVEAVGGDRSEQRDVLARLGAVCRPGAVLATTTSAAPVVELAVASGRPADVVGMHVVGRSPGRQAAEGLVEVVRTVVSDSDVVATAHAVCQRVGLRAVDCGDRAGFVVDALLHPYLNDAVRMVQDGYASVDDVDRAMVAGCGYPQGPFELLDSLGLDVAASVLRSLHQESREPGLAPAPLLEQMVTAGHLGRRTGRGFRDHG